MPLDKSASKASVGRNIQIEEAAGKPRKQAIAIALDVARRKRADGGGVPGTYIDEIKELEGDRDAGWDYKQYSGPYGVKRGANEHLTPEQAEPRFRAELSRAADMVSSLGVPMTMGQRAALASLTYNAGPGWMQSGLGDAVRRGDWERARQLFLLYNRAGGAENPGLVRRRQQEAAWFDEPDGGYSDDGRDITLHRPARGGAPAAPAGEGSNFMGDLAALNGPPESDNGPEIFGANAGIPGLDKGVPTSAHATASNATTDSTLSGINGPATLDRVQRALAMATAATPYAKASAIKIPHLPEPPSGRRTALASLDADDTPDDGRQMFAFGGPAQFAQQEARGKTHAGPLLSEVPGRTDKLPISVTAGSYVFPADVVSALGEGNTAAGNTILKRMLQGPFGMPTLHSRRLPRMTTSTKTSKSAAAKAPKIPKLNKTKYASGGAVPIIAAGGEYVATPEEVARIGDGDLDHGHAILDAFVKFVRDDHINTLKTLPPPAR